MTTPLRNRRAVLPPELARYLAASLLALIADVATLSATLRLLRVDLYWAATAGFMVGLAVAYALSIRWVFSRRAYARAPALEFVLFGLVGVAGLGITQVVLWLGSARLGLMPELVKLVAAGATFVFNYVWRRTLLFAGMPLLQLREDRA